MTASHDFSGYHVFVTGAGSGIGAAIARAFAAAGARVSLAGRRRAPLEQTCAALPNGAGLVLDGFDVTNADAIARGLKVAREKFGPVDILVNNAGEAPSAPFEKTDLAMWSHTISVDLTGVFLVTQAALPDLKKKGAGARILNVASTAGLKGYAYVTAYCAAKHGVTGYFDALRAEVETAYGIKVTTIFPGSVRTAVAANALNADGTVRGVSDVNIDNGIPADVAAAQILAGLNAGEREIVVAEGVEAGALELRRADPATLFAFTAAEGARLAAARAEGQGPEPAKVNT